MANIGRRSTAAELIRGDVNRGSYGEHLFFQRDGDAVVLVTEDDRILARGEGDGVKVYLEELEPLTVPYVNAFISHANMKAWKNWRSGTYKLVPLNKDQPLAEIQSNGSSNHELIDQLRLAPPVDPGNWQTLRTLAVVLYRASVELEQRSGKTETETYEVTSSR